MRLAADNVCDRGHGRASSRSSKFWLSADFVQKTFGRMFRTLYKTGVCLPRALMLILRCLNNSPVAHAPLVIDDAVSGTKTGVYL